MVTKKILKFKKDIKERVLLYSNNKKLSKISEAFFDEIGYTKGRNVYNYFWAGSPIIQLPQDIQTKQEIIWEYQPEFIIETGIAWGGSLLFYSSMLAILEDCKLIKNSRVIGVENKLRAHNRDNILSHPLSKRINILEGSSTSKRIFEQVLNLVKGKKTLVILDSNHTHKHVLKELNLYSQLIKKNGFIIVEDTSIENQSNHPSNREWGKGNSPLSAVKEFLKNDFGCSFSVENFYTKKSIISGMHDGILKKTK